MKLLLASLFPAFLTLAAAYAQVINPGAGGGGGGSGTVTSVGFTGGLVSVATPTTTPALTVAGTSGGIPYFSGAATWASSAAGTINHVVGWGGAGSAPVDLGVLPTVTGGTCTNQAATAISGSAVPTCTTITSAYVDSSIAPTASPTLVTPAITTSGTLSNNGLGTSPAGGYIAQNTTAAAASAQQYSPPVTWIGQGWKTTATAASQTVRWDSYVVPIQGAAAPTGKLLFLPTINASPVGTGIELCSSNANNIAKLGFNNDSCSVGFSNAATNMINVVLGFASTGNFSGNGYLSSLGSGLMFAAGAASTNTTGDVSLDRDAIGVIGVYNGTAPGTTSANYRDLHSRDITLEGEKATTGQRFACLDTNGKIVSSATACVGT